VTHFEELLLFLEAPLLRRCLKALLALTGEPLKLPRETSSREDWYPAALANLLVAAGWKLLKLLDLDWFTRNCTELTRPFWERQAGSSGL